MKRTRPTGLLKNGSFAPTNHVIVAPCGYAARCSSGPTASVPEWCWTVRVLEPALCVGGAHGMAAQKLHALTGHPSGYGFHHLLMVLSNPSFYRHLAIDFEGCSVADCLTMSQASPLKNRGDRPDSDQSQAGVGGRQAFEVRSFPQEPREYIAFRNEKGQPAGVGLVVLVEAAGIEPASAEPPPSVLHA